MKTALLPATRVAPELRKAVETLLEEGETVSRFIETAVTRHAAERTAQREFVARGLTAEAEADWVTADQVFTVVRKTAKRASRKR